MLTLSKIYAVKTGQPRTAKIRKKIIPATSTPALSPHQLCNSQRKYPLLPPNPSSMKIAKRCLIVYMITFLALLLSRGLWNNSAREYLTAWIFLNLCAIAIIVIFPGQSLYHAWYLTSHPGARYNFDDHGGLKGSDLANGFDKLYASFPHPHQFHFRGYLFTDQPPPGPAMTRPGSSTTFTSFIPTRSQPASQKSN